MKYLPENKTLSLLIIFLIYFVSYVVGYFASAWLKNTYCQILLFDVSATVVGWLFSLLFHNSSVYDAYWSLTPMVMITYLFVVKNSYNSIPLIIFYACFMIWGLRLTINWMITFDNLNWEDWRYRMFREKHPQLWPIINFFGIQMMPTLFVLGGFIPVIFAILNGLNWLSIIGSFIILIGVTFESLADHQMHKFLKTTAEKKTCMLGVWHYSRHPNYLGEILVWIGCYVAVLTSSLTNWYLGIGAIVIAIMFEVISIPLMEKRQIKRRSDYINYIKTTSRVLLLPNRKINKTLEKSQ